MYHTKCILSQTKCIYSPTKCSFSFTQSTAAILHRNGESSGTLVEATFGLLFQRRIMNQVREALLQIF